MGTTIVVHSYTGGVGKTTVGISLAYSLVRMGKRVVILDLDFESPRAYTFFDVQKYQDIVPINTAMFQDLPIETSLIDISQDLGEISGKLWIALSSGSSSSIIQATRRRPRDFTEEATRLFRWLSILKSNPYSTDFIIILTRGGINQSSINSVAASDITYIVMRPVIADIIGTSRMIEGMHKKLGCELRLIINMVPKEEVKLQLGDTVLNFIKEKTSLTELKVAGVIPVEIDLIRNEVEQVKRGDMLSGKSYHFSTCLETSKIIAQIAESLI